MKLSAWLKPEKLVLLLPAIFPLYLVKLELFGVPWNVLELVTVLLFLWQAATWLGNWWKSNKSEQKILWDQFWPQRKWFLILSAVFLFISVVAVAIVPKQTLLIDGTTIYQSRTVALGILKGWIVLPYMYFVLLWFGVKSKSDMVMALYAYIFSALPLVIWAFYQYGTGDFITADGRASGPFVNANYLAMYLAPAVVALWILITRGIVLGFKARRFVVGVILAAVYSVAMLMTQSYGAMLAVLLVLLLFFVLTIFIHRRFERHFELEILKKIGYFLLVFAFIAMVSAVLLYANTEKWKMFTNFVDRSSSSVRLQVYQIAESFIQESPLLGIGFGQFEPKYNLEAPRILGHAPYEWVMIHPHNTLLAIWLNLGIGGVILFVGLLVRCLGRLWRSASYDDQFFRLIGVSMLLVMVFHGMVDTYLFKNDLAFMFWLIVSLCLLPLNFMVRGLVEEGAQIGRKIGFPTANLRVLESSLPLSDLPFGVYAVVATVEGERYLGGLNYGQRPTVDNTPRTVFEVHLLNFDGNLYGKNIKVEVWDHLRQIFKFRDLSELRANLQNDLKEVRQKIKL